MLCFFFFKQKTAYELRISDWSSDVCSSDLLASETDGTRTLVHEITVPASLEEVWTALATVDGWRTWAVPLAREVPGSPDHFETGYDAGAEPGAASTIEQQWLERTNP